VVWELLNENGPGDGSGRYHRSDDTLMNIDAQYGLNIKVSKNPDWGAPSGAILSVMGLSLISADPIFPRSLFGPSCFAFW
jgi:hypothetical protein